MEAYKGKRINNTKTGTPVYKSKRIGTVNSEVDRKIAEVQQEAERKAQQEAVKNALLPEVKNGKLSLDNVAKAGGFSSEAEMKRYNAQNPNLSAVMGGTKYNPVPSETPTILTDEGQKVVDRAIQADKNVNSLDNKINEIVLKSAIEKQSKGETLNFKEFEAIKKHNENPNLTLEDIGEITEEADKDYKLAKKNEVLNGFSSAYTDYALAKKNNWSNIYNTAYNNNLVDKAQNSADFSDKSRVDNSVTDATYKYINDINGFRSGATASYNKDTDFATQYIDNPAGAAAYKFTRRNTKPAYMDNNYEYMTADEIKIYNYYYNTEGKEKAQKYLDTLESTLRQRANKELTGNMDDIAENSTAVASVLSVVTNIGAAFETGINAVKYVATGEMEQSDYALMTTALRTGVTNRVNWMIGDWDAHDFVYNTLMSGVDSLVMGQMGVAGEVMLGFSAAGSAANDVLERGGSNSQAFISGLIAGCAESIFEHISLGQLDVMKDTPINDWSDIAKNLIKAMGVNASEEGLTEIANLVTDYIVNGGISQYSLLVQEYIAEGETSESAREKAGMQLALQVGEAAASGAFMGFGFGVIGSGSSVISDTTRYNTAARAIIENGAENYIINTALKLNSNSKAYSLANEIQSSGTLDNRKLGQVAYEILSEVETESNSVIYSAVKKQILHSNATIDHKADIASIFKKSINGEELTTAEQKTLSKDNVAKQIFADLITRDAQWVQTLDTQLSVGREIANSVRSALNLPLQKVAQIAKENPILQSTANGGIINQNNIEFSGDDSFVDKRTTAASVEEIREQYFKKTPDNIRRGVEETAESFAKRTSGTGIESNEGTRRIRVNDGKASIFFAISEKNTPISRFIPKLKAVGIDAYFCEGPIETNENGVTNTRNEAFTTTSGKIFFSDSANLPSKEIVDHELVHNLLRQLNEDYFDYEDIIIRNLNRESNYYIAFCLELNEREYNNKFDISKNEFSISGASAFNSEILAYLYQKVLNDRSFADEFFSNMFYDWNEVINAVYKFNSKMVIDTNELTQATSNTEAASFMPENSARGGFDGAAGNNTSNGENTSQGEGNESDTDFELDEFDIREEKVDWIQQYGDKVAGYDRKTEGQRLLLKVAQKLGWKVGFANVYKRDKNGKVIRDENGKPQKADARVNKRTKEIVFDYDCQTPVKVLIKHELTHFLETNVAAYQDFANAVMNSKAFKTWIRTNGYESITDYNLAIRQTYNGVKGFENESDAEISANLEMVANFVAANLFSNEQAMLDRLVAELNPAQRSKLNEIVHKLLTALKNAFAGMTQEGEIQKLENKWIETYKKAETAWQEKQEAGDQTDKSKNEYSFALEKDTSLIAKAEQMEQEGVNRDEIWEELRIIRDIDGAWVYEIDDSEMKFYPEGDVFIKDDPEYKEFKHLDRLDKMTTKQIERYADLEDRFMLQYGYGPWLKNYLVHDKLYAKFPHLKETVLQVVPDSKDYSGYYDPNTNTIAITENVMYGDKIELNKTVIHEIQHALQTFEDRENGANVEFWNARILSGKAPTHPITGEKLNAEDAYRYTAGEIEAREASERYELYDEWRELVTPDFGWDYAIRAGKLPAAVNKEYINAVENGNIEEAQQIVDTVARATGYTERLYHQTNADFTEFNTDNQRAGKYDWELPTGTFLKPTDSDIGLSGKKQMELYANIRNPLVFANRYAAQKFWSENIKGYSEAAQAVKNIDIEYREKTDRAINAVQAYKKKWRAENPDADSRELYNDLEFQRLDGQEERIIEEWERKSNEASLKAKKLIDDFIVSRNYDGIIIERDQGSFGRSTKTYIVFDSSQLKDASPVTRDDNGNVIALSERFNKGKRDIRYSRPIQSSVDNNNDDGVQYSLINNQFPPYNQSQSDANEWATRWAQSEGVETGDQKLASYHNRWYLIEKFDDVEFGYRIMERVNKKMYEYYKGVIGDVRDRDRTSIVSSADEIDSSLGERNGNSRSDRITDNLSNEHAGTNTDVFKLGARKSQANRIRSSDSGLFGTGTERDSTQSGNTENTVSIEATSDDEVAFSMPEKKYSIAVEKENPKTIADLTEADASTTPPLERKKGVARSNRQSKTYESLLGSDIFDETFKKEVKDNEFIRKYQSIGNEKTMREAAQELDEGGQQYVNSWWNLEPQRASLVDTAVGFILMDRYQRVGDYESAVAVAEKVREFGTASGQQVQIFSILGRLDANSMVVYAQKELSKAFETMVEGRTKAWINKNAERFQLTDDDIEFIRRHTLQAAQLPEGRDKAIRLAEISALLQDKLPAEKGQALRAFQRTCMLLNIKTNVRNIVGNLGMVPVFVFSDFFGSGIDRLLSKKSNVRTTGNFDIKSVKGFKKGAYETMDDFRRHINTRNQELNRFEVGQGKSFNDKGNGLFNTGILAKQMNDCAKVLNALDRFTSFCLELGDRPFYEMWYINSINNQMKLNKVSEPTPEMIVIASNEALQRTWQDSNKIVDMVSKFKNGLNTISVNGYGLGDVLIKFTKTPANLTKAIFDFSPAGFIKSLAVDSRAFNNSLQTGQFTPEIQKRFVDTLSKGIVGTLLYILAFGLASAGMLSGGSDDDKDVANFEKYIQGIPPYSVKLFGKWYSYEWMQPIGAISASVADYMKARKESVDNKWYDDVLLAVKAGGEVLYNQSFMKSIQNLFTADNVIDGIIDSVLDEPSVFVPQMLSQLANATDKYRRTTYEPNDAFKTALNNVKYKIPGLRQTFEKQVDVLGREVPNSQYGMINAFLNPANTYTDTSDDITDEVYNLYKQTGKLSVIPRTAPNYVEVKGTKIKFSAEQKMDFQRSIGKRSAELLDELFASDEYQDLSDSQKVSVVEDIYSFATAVAKSELKYDYETLSAMIGENSNGKPYLSESDYKKLSSKAKKEYAKEYFLSKTEMKYINNYESLISHYIEQSK